MASKPAQISNYEVVLRGKNPAVIATIEAKFMHVNHRGDLLLSNVNSFESPCVACFASGSWLSARKIEKPEDRMPQLVSPQEESPLGENWQKYSKKKL